jgi:hypothetical protein
LGILRVGEGILGGVFSFMNDGWATGLGSWVYFNFFFDRVEEERVCFSSRVGGLEEPLNI